MKRFKNILIVFNSKLENRALINYAVNLAKRNQAVLTVVDVIKEEPDSLTKRVFQESTKETPGLEISIIEELPSQINLSDVSTSLPEDQNEKTNQTAQPSIDIHEFIIQEEQRSLQQFVKTIQQAGIQVNSKTLFGIPFIKIIQEVLHHKHDLVLITPDGSGNIKETLFGSTTMHLMRKCPVPVWVIKPDQANKFNRILAAVDVTPDNPEGPVLAQKIMELATSLARIERSELIIAHAWNMVGESILRGRAGISNENIENLLQETQNMHRQWVVELLQQHPLDDLKAEVYMLKGDPGTVITEMAQAKTPDLIVMGTVSRTGISGLLIGNTAEKVLRQVNCSVLTVKPDGFISPVKSDQG